MAGWWAWGPRCRLGRLGGLLFGNRTDALSPCQSFLFFFFFYVCFFITNTGVELCHALPNEYLYYRASLVGRSASDTH